MTTPGPAVAVAEASTTGVPTTGAGAPPAPQAREVFVAASARPRSDLSSWRHRLSWPLGIYTTPVAILIVWEILAQAGVLGPGFAPAPTSIASNGWHLWQQGILGPDLAISLRRAAVGLALGLGAGITAGVLAGLLSNGKHLFSGVVQIFNTIPILAILPVMIVWFGMSTATNAPARQSAGARPRARWPHAPRAPLLPRASRSAGSMPRSPPRTRAGASTPSPSATTAVTGPRRWPR